jgi:hypothetical protein
MALILIRGLAQRWFWEGAYGVEFFASPESLALDFGI